MSTGNTGHGAFKGVTFGMGRWALVVRPGTEPGDMAVFERIGVGPMLAMFQTRERATEFAVVMGRPELVPVEFQDLNAVRAAMERFHANGVSHVGIDPTVKTTTSSQPSPTTLPPTRPIDPTKFRYLGTLRELAAAQGKVVEPWPTGLPNPFLRATEDGWNG